MECRVHLHNGKEVQQREIDELLTYLVPKNESPGATNAPRIEGTKKELCATKPAKSRCDWDQTRE